jgi:hypothetical protein
MKIEIKIDSPSNPKPTDTSWENRLLKAAVFIISTLTLLGIIVWKIQEIVAGTGH